MRYRICRTRSWGQALTGIYPQSGWSSSFVLECPMIVFFYAVYRLCWTCKTLCTLFGGWPVGGLCSCVCARSEIFLPTPLSGRLLAGDPGFQLWSCFPTFQTGFRSHLNPAPPFAADTYHFCLSRGRILFVRWVGQPRERHCETMCRSM